jgi:cyanophycin synthetase
VNVKNALAAVAVAYVSHVSLDHIRTGLRSFSTSFYQAPGRLNLLEVGGYRVIVDYCHNVGGIMELAEFVRRMQPTHALGVVAMPGDRRDEDIREFGAIAATMFDEYIIREDTNRRGRAVGEVAGLLKQTLVDNGVAAERIEIVLDEIEAANRAMDRARPDDLVVVLVDKPAEVWDVVAERARSVANNRVAAD